MKGVVHAVYSRVRAVALTTGVWSLLLGVDRSRPQNNQGHGIIKATE